MTEDKLKYSEKRGQTTRKGQKGARRTSAADKKIQEDREGRRTNSVRGNNRERKSQGARGPGKKSEKEK